MSRVRGIIKREEHIHVHVHVDRGRWHLTALGSSVYYVFCTGILSFSFCEYILSGCGPVFEEVGDVFVGVASRAFSRSGLGCWTPMLLRKLACCQRLGYGIMY